MPNQRVKMHDFHWSGSSTYRKKKINHPTLNTLLTTESIFKIIHIHNPVKDVFTQVFLGDLLTYFTGRFGKSFVLSRNMILFFFADQIFHFKEKIYNKPNNYNMSKYNIHNRKW